MTRLKSRYNIEFKTIIDETVDVNIYTVKEWKRKLPEKSKDFDAVTISMPTYPVCFLKLFKMKPWQKEARNMLAENVEITTYPQFMR